MTRRFCSANEVLQIARKACIGSGMPVDRAEDLAEAAVVLHSSGYEGLAALLDLLREHDANAAQIHAPVQLDLSVAKPSAQNERLMVNHLRPQFEGVAVIDWLLANPDTGVALIRELDNGVIMIGLLVCAVQRYGGVFELQVLSENETVKIADLSVLTSGLPETAGWTLSYQAGAVAAASPLCHPTDIELAVWRALEKWAYLTYVPATEASRQKGAGAGLVDND